MSLESLSTIEVVSSKVCYKCKIEKDESEFSISRSSNDGLQSMCKMCRKQYNKQTKHLIKAQNDKYYAENHLELKRYQKWYREEGNPEKIAKDKREYHNKQYHEDECFRLRNIFSTLIRQTLAKIRDSKKSNSPSWEQYVDYTVDDLKLHLENKFKDNMCWKNYGEWSIDHIIPQSLFHYTSYNDEEFKKCWKLENLQPLWNEENNKKSNKLLD